MQRGRRSTIVAYMRQESPNQIRHEQKEYLFEVECPNGCGHIERVASSWSILAARTLAEVRMLWHIRENCPNKINPNNQYGDQKK